ncbi:MAG: N-acetyltransferase, partial [Proteobacteria bacterium]|nr:N-acetyltransferase [Pseudomonadota bacterium]
MTEIPNGKTKRPNLIIREMEIDDIAPVFHLGEKLFTARKVPNLYRTWDEYEVVSLYQTDPEYCLVAEIDDTIVGFALGTTITKSSSAWKYG